MPQGIPSHATVVQWRERKREGGRERERERGGRGGKKGGEREGMLEKGGKEIESKNLNHCAVVSPSFFQSNETLPAGAQRMLRTQN